jgi:hypothetical protein
MTKRNLCFEELEILHGEKILHFVIKKFTFSVIKNLNPDPKHY